ncbi:MAG: hypothetical protein M0Z43_05830 [Acidithiobacillus sp.]|jgi:hypothetical protein|nr:hypothetical protein [Acidithiobacillus sp.]
MDDDKIGKAFMAYFRMILVMLGAVASASFIKVVTTPIIAHNVHHSSSRHTTKNSESSSRENGYD